MVEGGAGKAKVSTAEKVTAQQQEISRLRAEVARLKMERDIEKKAAGAPGDRQGAGGASPPR
jgi:transposase-like protein